MAVAFRTDLGQSQIKTSGTTLTLSLSLGTPQAGDCVVVSIGADNLTGTTPTVTSLTKPAGETATWYIYNTAATQTSGGAGVIGAIAVIFPTITWTGFNPVITWSNAVTAKVATASALTGVANVRRNSAHSLNNGSTQTYQTPLSISGGQTGDLLAVASIKETTTTTIANFTPDIQNTTGIGSGGSIFTSGGSTATNIGIGSSFRRFTSNGTAQLWDFNSGVDTVQMGVIFAMAVEAPPTNVSASDTATATDSATVEQSAVLVSATDPELAIDDASVTTAILSATDARSSTDAASVAVTLPAADAATATDSASVVQGPVSVSASDTAAAVDAAAPAVSPTVADSASSTDAATLGVQRAAADVVTAGDAATVEAEPVQVAASDAASSTENASASIGIIELSALDTASGADTASVARTSSTGDTAAGTDTAAPARTSTATDVATGTDTAAPARTSSTADTAAAADTATPARTSTATDTATRTETATVARTSTVADTASAVDAATPVPATLVAADAASSADSATVEQIADFLAPTGLTAVPVSTSQINLSWDPVPTAVYYQLERDGIVIANPDGTTFADTGLAEASSHSYRVRAVK